MTFLYCVHHLTHIDNMLLQNKKNNNALEFCFQVERLDCITTLL